jgi:hypothetical protein
MGLAYRMMVSTSAKPAVWLARAKTMINQPIKLPGWAALLLFIYTIIPDTVSRISFWIETAKTTGGYVAYAAAIVSSPYFGPALLAAGLAWILFVGEPAKGVQRHHWMRYVGWAVIAICVTAIIVTATYGWFELRLRQAYAEGAAGVPRGTPDAPNRPQLPFTTNWGSLSPDQMRILIQELPRLRLTTPRIDFFSVPNDNIGWQYWHQFNDAFQRSGIAAPRSDQLPRGPEEEGLMLEVRDKGNIPEAAQKLLEAFAIANVKIRVIEAPKGLLGSGTEFAVFIGPAPIRWR